MKKFVFFSDEAIAALESDKRVDGSVKKDPKTGRLVFSDWKRKAPKYYKEKKICDLDFGWVGETEKHITRREKFPKILGYSYIRSAMDRDNQQTQGALTDKEILENV